MNSRKSPRSFYIYFWRTYFRKTKKTKWAINYKGERLIVDGMKILVPTETKTRKRNPHAVVSGKASKITIKARFATIM